MSLQSLIKMSNINKTYTDSGHRNQVLDNLSLTVSNGEFVTITGASGVGKSTLMDIIGLLDSPTTGEYILDGESVVHMDDKHRSDLRNQLIGFAFQSYFLLPEFTALQNVSLPLIYRNLTKAEIKERSLAMLERVGLGGRATFHPSQLSGGQQQRVAIARALVGSPKLLIADEPTAALGDISTKTVLELFQKFHQEDKLTIIIVTHDPEVAKLGTQRLILANGILSSGVAT
jgi:putative ABC transport system ATP-binding protein